MQRTPVFAQLWRNSNRDVVIVPVNTQLNRFSLLYDSEHSISAVTAKILLALVQTVMIFTRRRIKIRNLTSLNVTFYHVRFQLRSFTIRKYA